MEAIKQQVPQLRFSEFRQKWNKNKVGELCDFIVPGRNKPKQFNGDIPWITTPDIGINGIISLSKKGLAISKEEAKKIGSKIVPINSVVISCVGELGITATSGREIIINQQLHAFIPKENLNYKFLLYSIGLQKRYMEKIATKTALPYMNKDNCNSIPIFYPSLPEQQKIATFLTAVDKKISQLQEKKDLLEQYKKGVMQQIFSQELRFKDDDGNDFSDWEEKKYKDVFSFYSTNSLSRDKLNYEKGEVLNVHYGDIHTKFSTLLDIDKESVPYINQNIDLSKIKEDSYLQIGDLLIADASEDYNDIGKTVEVINLNEKKVISGLHTFHARPNKHRMAIGFSGYLVQSWAIRKQVMKIAQGTKVLGISTSRLGEINLSIPSLAEQTKIANFLSSIDTKIALVSTQLENTQEFKKGLLQQLFV